MISPPSFPHTTNKEKKGSHKGGKELRVHLVLLSQNVLFENTLFKNTVKRLLKSCVFKNAFSLILFKNIILACEIVGPNGLLVNTKKRWGGVKILWQIAEG
jgi:hypothetical protein